MKPTRTAGASQAVLLLALMAGVFGCTADEAATTTTTATSQSTAGQPTDAQPTDAQPTDAQPDDAASAPEDGDQAEIDEPSVRPADNPGDGSSNHWIGRGLMTSSSVEVVWSPLDGAEVNYRIHRFAKGDSFDPEQADLTESTVVYDGTDSSFTDSDVEADLFYYYLLEATVDGQTLSVRWTEALTTDDTEPPSPVTDLTAVTTDDQGVLLTWAPSSDNVEFAAYAVYLINDESADGEPATYVGGGADLGQTSFLDDRPPPFPVTYSVVAVDFHDNRSAPALVTIDRE